MKPKLTNAQKALLQEIIEQGESKCIDSYKPAKKLIELGLVEHETLKFGMLRLFRES